MFYRYRNFRKNLRQEAKDIRENGIKAIKEHNFSDISFYENFSLIFKFAACAILFFVSIFKNVSLLKLVAVLGLARQGTPLKEIIGFETLRYYFYIPLAVIFIISFLILYAVMNIRLRKEGSAITRHIFSAIFLVLGIATPFVIKNSKLKDTLPPEIFKPEHLLILYIAIGLLLLFISVRILCSNEDNKTYMHKMMSIDWLTLVRMPLIMALIENLTVLLWCLCWASENVMPVIIGAAIFGLIFLFSVPLTLSSDSSNRNKREADKLRKEADYYDNRSTQHGTIGNAFGRDEDDRKVANELRKKANALDRDSRR